MTNAVNGINYTQWKAGKWETLESGVVVEKAVSLTVNGELWLSFMCTPADLEAQAVLITRGEEGMTLFQNRARPKHFPTRASEVYDVTGAGDTVISVLAAALAAGASLHEGIALANAAAGIVVRELGTASVRPEELEAAFS